MTKSTGIILSALLCAALPLSAAQQRGPAPVIVATPLHATGIYAAGEKAGWTITATPGTPVPAGDFSYTVKTNNSATIKTGTFSLATGSATIEVTQTEPAMLYVQVTPPPPAPVAAVAPAAAATEGGAAPAVPAQGAALVTRRGGARPGRGGGGGLTLGAAVAPTKLQPSVPRPADFDTFWDGKLAELAKIPINPVLMPVPPNQDGIELYTVMLDSVGSHVQGYLAKPAKAGKYPALIMYQWAGVYSLEAQTLGTVKDRAAEGWLVFNVDSHDIPPNSAAGAPANYQSVGNTDRETSYFLNMYLRDARAVDYLKTRADWDGKIIVFQGTSMGGQQSLATAGLRPNDITAVIINVPSGANIDGSQHGRTAGYPNWGTNDPKVAATAPYFDVINFAHRIKAPVVAAMGFIDTTSPPVGVWTALNQIPVPHEAIPMVESDHNHITPEKQGAWDARSKEVRDLILKGGEFKPNPATSRP